ncbi:peptidylprolyl isomerase [Robiginitalea sp. IMCC43444]|uniref:peptidylprolyl isomerase n=1 Tax=Robiginitalea sp. IMCC43444 TaxID=3459121 RepID=UPI0040418618
MFATSCRQQTEEASKETADPIQVELQTEKGIIVLELSDKTPLHRDNFIKITREGRLDSMLFHRVLEGFVAQAGEYDSLRMARMDSTQLQALNYRIPAEIDSSLFHKRGAMGAARTANPERASSPLSFYIVQRGPRPDSLIKRDEERINTWLQQHFFLNAPENKQWKDSLTQAEADEDRELFLALTDTINTLAESFEFSPYRIPEAHREVYRTLGGTPHLDQNYTVFGEVISGMEVVDSIARVPVNEAGRPAKNLYILKARVISESE